MKNWIKKMLRILENIIERGRKNKNKRKKILFNLLKRFIPLHPSTHFFFVFAFLFTWAKW